MSIPQVQRINVTFDCDEDSDGVLFISVHPTEESPFADYLVTLTVTAGVAWDEVQALTAQLNQYVEYVAVNALPRPPDEKFLH